MKSIQCVFSSIAAVALALVGCGPKQPQEAISQELLVTSFGGAYQTAQREAYMQPFAKEHGIEIVEGEYNGEYGLLAHRATSPNGTWDVVSVESAPTVRGENEGLFRELPDFVFEGLDLVPGARRKHAAAHLQFGTIAGFRVAEGTRVPTGWADFWNLRDFPGKRGLRNNPRGTLEIALLGDGVEPSNLYPLDVDRALRKLQEIRDEVIFWESGAQPVQLLANGAVAMTSVYNGRIWAAQVQDKLPVGWTLNGGLLELEFWAVPKNAPHPEAAYRFIRESLQPKQQSEFANRIAYVPTNSAAIQRLTPEVLKALPLMSNAEDRAVLVDADWWAANERSVAARWQQWMVSGRHE